MGLIKEYKKAGEYIKSSKNFIYLMIIIYLISFIFGMFQPVFREETHKILFEGPPLESPFEIFINNSRIAFFKVFLGFTVFIPFFITSVNGYVIGLGISEIMLKLSSIHLFSLLLIGSMELTVGFIGGGIGLRTFEGLFRGSFRNCFWNNLRVFLLIILLVLFIASIIEFKFILYFS